MFVISVDLVIFDAMQTEWMDGIKTTTNEDSKK